jgi:dTDP-4-amino-4,6-dideoxygalactose transaminase
VEEIWAERHGVPHALLVASGSTAVELALRALEIGPGDEVLVPALGWYATAAAVSRVGATAVFFDIDPATSCPDPAAAQAGITPRTRAVIAVHLHCGLADLRAFREVADGAGLALLEDAAQAHGAAFEGRSVGTWGDVGCFSFNQEKTLPIGEGGALVTADPRLHRRLYALRTDGYAPGGAAHRANREVQGANACLSELQAALLPGQIEAFDALEARRRETAGRLETALATVKGLSLLGTAPGTTARPYYEFGLVFEDDAWGDWSVPLLGKALSAELGADLHPTDEPVPACALFDPTGRRQGETPPRAADLYRRLLVFHHRLLLEPRLVEVLPEALHKIRRAVREMREIPAARRVRPQEAPGDGA